MFYIYLVVSAALLPILDIFFEIFRHQYSWWLVPVLFIGIFLGLSILQLLVMLISIALINPKSPPERGSRYYRFILKISLPLMMKFVRVKLNVTGEDKIPQNTRMLFVCNHQHDIDPAILLAAFPDAEIGFIAKKEIYVNMPFVAKVMHKLHCLPIDRENDREAAKTIISAIKLLKDDVVSVALFPEGYVSKSCELLPFRNGAFKIAYKAQVPIVVCVINNTRVAAKSLGWRHSEIDLRVLGVMQYEDFKDMTTTQLGELLHGQMSEALKEMRGENRQPPSSVL